MMWDDVILDGENCVQIVVRINGRLFHISFRPEKLREPDQSNPSKFELEYLDLVKAAENFCEEDPDAFPEQSLSRAHSPQESSASEYDPSICYGSYGHGPPSSSISSRSLRQQPRNPFFQLYAIRSLSPFYYSPQN